MFTCDDSPGGDVPGHGRHLQSAAPLANPVPRRRPRLACDVQALSLRDKLAQLLMVGVRDAADARAVVTDNHVGGIFIGSWTDRSMLTDGSIPDIASAAGPLALAVSVDEEGGRVQRLSSLIGSQPAPWELAQTKTADEVYQIALQRGQAMRGRGITVDFAPVVDVTPSGGRQRDRRPILRLGSRGGHGIRRRLRARTA